MRRYDPGRNMVERWKFICFKMYGLRVVELFSFAAPTGVADRSRDLRPLAGVSKCPLGNPHASRRVRIADLNPAFAGA